jgi:transcriptional regulator with XRE-family HTH domain
VDIKARFARTLRDIRKAQKLTQEDFSIVSSRTYLSTLERGLQSPTLDKLDELASVMRVHPVTLLALAYSDRNAPDGLSALLEQVRDQARQLFPSDAS